MAASLDAQRSDHVELRHGRLGQHITEGWRANLHALFGALNEPAGSAQRVRVPGKFWTTWGWPDWPREAHPRRQEPSL